MTEDIQLAKKVDLLKKIGRVRIDDTAKLAEMLSAINTLRCDRNDLMHGIWHINVKDDGSLEATCSHRKIAFKQMGNDKQWTRALVVKHVPLDRLRKMAIQLEQARRTAEEMIENLTFDPL